MRSCPTKLCRAETESVLRERERNGSCSSPALQSAVWLFEGVEKELYSPVQLEVPALARVDTFTSSVIPASTSPFRLLFARIARAGLLDLQRA